MAYRALLRPAPRAAVQRLRLLTPGPWALRRYASKGDAEPLNRIENRAEEIYKDVLAPLDHFGLVPKVPCCLSIQQSIPPSSSSSSEIQS